MNLSALAVLLSDPARAEALRREELPEVLGQVERLRAALWVRVNTPEPNGHGEPSDIERASGDQLLNAKEVADILQTDARYVYRHAD